MVMQHPYQIDFRGPWSLDQRRLVTEAIVEVEMQHPEASNRPDAKRWVCQQHHRPSPRYFAHHVQRSIVLQAASAPALASKIRQWGHRPNASVAQS